jgi:hypothetical protein
MPWVYIRQHRYSPTPDDYSVPPYTMHKYHTPQSLILGGSSKGVPWGRLKKIHLHYTTINACSEDVTTCNAPIMQLTPLSEHTNAYILSLFHLEGWYLRFVFFWPAVFRFFGLRFSTLFSTQGFHLCGLRFFCFSGSAFYTFRYPRFSFLRAPLFLFFGLRFLHLSVPEIFIFAGSAFSVFLGSSFYTSVPKVCIFSGSAFSFFRAPLFILFGTRGLYFFRAPLFLFFGPRFLHFSVSKVCICSGLACGTSKYTRNIIYMQSLIIYNECVRDHGPQPGKIVR